MCRLSRSALPGVRLELCQTGQQPEIKAKYRSYQTGICTHGPVVAAIWSNNALIDFRGDTIFTETDPAVPHFGPTTPSKDIVNHAVIITGWDETKRAWRVRNSWGDNFGIKGYAWLQYGANNIAEVTYWADAMPLSATQGNVRDLKAVDAAIRPKVSNNARRVLKNILN